MSERAGDPWGPFGAWMTEASESEPDVPDAMQLATVSAEGRPSLRTVLLKEWGPKIGFVFYTNLGSRKARQLIASPHAALLLHWKSRARQVIAEGEVHRIDAARADAYWTTRPRGSQLGAWASLQSEPLASHEELSERVAEVTRRFEGQPVPRPPFWSGFALRPVRIELWQGREDRLHHRRLFRRVDDTWLEGKLYP